MPMSADLLIADLPAKFARRTPDKLAIRSSAGDLTYAALADRVERLASGFSAQGVAAGCRLALIAPNSQRFLEIILACARLGATVVPVNVRLIASEMAFQIDDAGANFVIVDPSLAPIVDKIDLHGRSVWYIDSDIDRVTFRTTTNKSPLIPIGNVTIEATSSRVAILWNRSVSSPLSTMRW